MSIASFTLEALDGRARRGRVSTHRGTFPTPCFMPVGTRGAVRLLDSTDLDALGPAVVLANTYHLMLRPGAETVAALGGLHRFTGRDGHILTDSGGYQVFSLGPKVDAGGVTFRSTYDGSLHRLTPEDAVRTQELLGADIQMALDICPGLPAPDATVRAAMDRTLEWAARARPVHRRDDQCLFGIVQGGINPEWREESALATAALDFDGYGIGGLSVGEPLEQMLPALDAALGGLPHDRPRYLMGVGDPHSMVEAVALGVDMFDCVLPTRLARHGTALSGAGRFQLKAARFAVDDGPLDPDCPCPVCARWSRGYLRHLFSVGEPTAGRLLTIHNLSWLLGLVERMRAAISAGTFDELRAEVAAVWDRGSPGVTGIPALQSPSRASGARHPTP
ncbi:tRNA guanosine(34) transglycosylase Tgt [Acidiferrimicrobium sp. IK]|uniref:tRNA guanosine(34) transglycosylase Tgt n=1 Tax=Acidiferrimicrobium sp. IK TaxID=2871700 RepID=UPI0021CB0B3B|nr:tRNA guanosine(34) transglycosylase Tgt [Acidiferrimicrobium sp. IK]